MPFNFDYLQYVFDYAKNSLPARPAPQEPCAEDAAADNPTTTQPSEE